MQHRHHRSPGFPEMLGGRVKTLHPAMHGGILARRNQAHLSELHRHQRTPIDDVVVNLSPFQETVAQSGVTLADAVEEIDMGGVALRRAAAKHHASVTVLCDPDDDASVAATCFTASSGNARGPSETLRLHLACKALRHTADYVRLLQPLSLIREHHHRSRGQGVTSADASRIIASEPRRSASRIGGGIEVSCSPFSPGKRREPCMSPLP
jgi:AICAR transformylase/IMP cyclohydrolase PurH